MALINDSVSVKQVILEKIDFTIRKAIHDPNIEINISFMENYSRQAFFELREYIWAEKLQETTQDIRFEFAYPSSWWQYFKQDYFPQWLLKRFPVDEIGVIRDKKITFKRYATFPKFRYKSEKEIDKFVIHEYINEKQLL